MMLGQYRRGGDKKEKTQNEIVIGESGKKDWF